MNKKYNITRFACYMSNVTMAVAVTVTPLLYITFHDMYGMSYTFLGLLALLNFCTQLLIDITFSFFSYKFNIKKTVIAMPLITITGMLVFSLMPMLIPTAAKVFIPVGTVIFSASAGLGEVLLSPIIAALPSDNPERDMSISHSAYAWGVVVVVLLSTLYLKVFGDRTWYIMAMLWCIIPSIAFILFCRAEIPTLDTPKNTAGTFGLLKNPILILCIFSIFFGSLSENTMSQWCSGYIEKALGIDKTLGDVFGVAVFAAMLGLGRTLYAKYGKKISKVILAGFISAAVCYLTAALSHNPVIGLIACGLTGFCTSMLWPGTLIFTAEMIPSAGVAIYAMLAAGGDFGASVGPQIVGIIADKISATADVSSLSVTAEQYGFKAGMLVAALFPLIGIIVACIMRSSEKKSKINNK